MAKHGNRLEDHFSKKRSKRIKQKIKKIKTEKRRKQMKSPVAKFIQIGRQTERGTLHKKKNTRPRARGR